MNLKNSEYFSILDGVRVKILELVTLYIAWVAENFEPYEIRALFQSRSIERLKSDFDYLGYIDSSGLTREQVNALLEITYEHWKKNYTSEKMVEFFQHRKRAVIRSSDRVWQKFFKLCRRCGRVLCYHKAKGLCRYCYHKVWMERKEISREQVKKPLQL